MSEIIDINVLQQIDEVTINVTEEVITVNINKITSGGGGSQNLNQVLEIGNETDGQNIVISNGDAIVLDNGSKLIKGTTNAGLGGNKGIALRCSIDYEFKWEAGRLYVMEQDGFTIREVSYNFTNIPAITDDVSKGFIVGSRWILDNGIIYICTDAALDSAIWEIESGGGTWGSITGDLIDQTDLYNALESKVDKVTGERLINAVEITKLANTSGVNTGDQDLSGLATITYVDNQDFLKVDKVVGKGLSTNDFTDALETKLNGIEAGAEVNVNADWNAISGDAQILNKPIIPTQGLTSVGLTMPIAFNVANSPLIADGTLAVTAAGTASQYIRGDGQLATLPTGGGGGSSVSYYLNGGVNSSVAGYKQMSNEAVIGIGTNFPITGNGLIAQFLTDIGNPNRIQIPGGAWNFEMFFNVSSAGVNPKFYVDLLEYDGISFNLIASGLSNPEVINGGTSTDLYLTSLAVPTYGLSVTDRLAIRVYIINNAGGVTVTLHTEDNTLCEIITTFSGGVTSLNGLTENTQYLAVGTAGTDFNINSLTDTHTFNLPTASALNRGALSSANWSTFNGKQDALGYTAENQANKEDLLLDNSSIKYPTNNLVKTNVDLKADIASPTFTGTVTTPAIIVSDETINTIASFDATKNIKSLPTVTYPDLTELSYVKGVTSAIQTQLNGKQAGDATLTSLAAYNTNGILTQTSADTFTGRTITGTTNRVTVTNGDGVAGNPTLTLPQDIHTAAAPQFARLGLGAAANLASYLNVIANTATVGQLYLPPSAVDYTGTLSGMLWNNASEWKFYDGVLSSVNRLLKLNGNTALANSNALNVVTSTGTGGNLGTLKAEVAFSRYPTAVSYTILLTDIGFGWVVAVTSTAAARTITLPLANAVAAGWKVTIKDESGGALTNNITIARAGADTIDGATINVINLNYGSRTVYSDGVSKWFTI